MAVVTARVLEVQGDFIRLRFLDNLGAEVHVGQYRLPANGNVREMVRAEMARMNAKAIVDVLNPGDDVTPEPAPPPEPPDPDQSVKDTFLNQLFLRRQLQKAVDLGLINANDPRYTQQINSLKQLFDAQTQAVQLKIIRAL